MITPSFSLTATERVLPKLALDFTTASLDSRITFTRAGNTATVVNSSGFIATINADLPRFDYNPVTLACNGLLIEESRTNLYSSSNGFATNWTANASSFSANSITSPDGTQNATKLIPNNGTVQAYCFITSAPSVTSGTSYTGSIFAKKDEFSFLQMTGGTAGFGSSQYANFNLTTGALGNVAGGTARITDFGNGWYRCQFTVAATANASASILAVVVSSATVPRLNAIAGGGVKGLHLYGAQLEAGAFATSYIPTTSAALTRNADVATITGSNFSSFWQASKGGTQVQAIPSTLSGIRPLVQYDDGTADNIIALRGNAANPELQIVDGGAPQVQLDAGTIVVNTPYSLTGWWQENNSFAQLNTQASVRDNTVTIPTVTQARIGSDSTNYLNGHIATIDYYDELSNSIYDSLRLLGYTGTVTDMLLQYYLARGATSNSLTDAELEFLITKGFTTGTVDDRWVDYLNSLGYVGTITDMKYQYWKSPE